MDQTRAAQAVSSAAGQSGTEASSVEQAPTTSHDPYTTFSKAQKRRIVLIVAFAGMFSPLSSFIYYPATNALASGLRTSVEAINLSITSYMIVSGILPSIIGDAADRIGRRPVYIFAFIVYFFANLGLALQDSLPALIVLRMLQSMGSSGTISQAYGVIADIAPSSERGSYVGAVLCGPNVAPSLGPVLGGVLADRAGWRWIFWFLCIISGFCLVVIAFFLPETARQVVGNGSIPTRGVNQTLVSRFSGKTTHRNDVNHMLSTPGKKSKFLNPFTCITIILYKDIASVLLVNAIFYMIYCCIQASLSSSFISIYHYQELGAGLIYLPFGFGCAMASYASGKIMNRDYRIVAKKMNFVIDRVKGDDLNDFPIEKARLRSIWYFLVVVIVSVAGYGWSLYCQTHVAVPLVLQFFIGASTTVIFNICGTLAVDLNPLRPSTISAGSNLIRCSLAAAGLAVLQIMIGRLGVGWCFTIFAAIAAITIPLLLVERHHGPMWRLNRDAKSRAMANCSIVPHVDEATEDLNDQEAQSSPDSIQKAE